MKNYIQIFEIFCKHTSNEGWGFNPNFVEANVINISLLLSGLIYVLKQFLGATLVNRREKVLTTIQEAEERLEQANLRLTESEKQLAQTQIIIDQIEKEARITAEKVRNSILSQGTLDIERLTAASRMNITTAEKQVRQQIRQRITALAIQEVSLQLKHQIKPLMQSRIIDNDIAQLGDQL
uniref:ATP synthase CFO B chain subunit I n=1 Tax=Rhodogorgon sp. TaxID=2485824 RepID=A0A3G3MI29_9FLOR|nr:ATP synthase CFO B chain subunit I [Rhodogorgon sp.]